MVLAEIVRSRKGGGRGDVRMRGRTARAADVLEERGGSLIGGLIVTHGQLAFELLNAAEMIEGKLEGIEAVPLEWNDPVEDSREKIRQALDRIGEDEGVIIFTDMFGGTPSNISLSFLDREKVEIVTGVNLPMIIKFMALKGSAETLNEVAHMIREKGAKSIRVASDLLAGEPREGSAE